MIDDRKRKAMKIDDDEAITTTKRSISKKKNAPSKINSDHDWQLVEEHDGKEDGLTQMKLMDDHAFVRSCNSNASNSCFECCAHEDCDKKHKLVSKKMKWCLLVNDKEHANLMKKMPSRKNGLPAKGAKGKARGHIQQLVNCRHTGTATVENELVMMNNDNPTATWAMPPTTKIKHFLNHQRIKNVMLVDMTLDVVNWHEPLAITTKEESLLKTDDCDVVVLGEPLNRKIMMDIYDANGNVKLDKNDKKTKEEKLVFGFVVATVKMMNVIKLLTLLCPNVHMQTDGTHRLNKHGWVLVVATMHYMRFDVSRGTCVRTPLPSLPMVAFTECKVGVVCLCNTFKTLLIKHYSMQVEIIAMTVSQDMSVFTRDGVKEAWPDSLDLPCSTCVGRKFDDGSVGKKIRNKNNVKNTQRHVDFLLRCQTKDMTNVFSKLMVNNWKNVKNEHEWTRSFSSVHMSENDWNSDFFFSASGTPWVASDHQNLIENVN